MLNEGQYVYAEESFLKAILATKGTSDFVNGLHGIHLTRQEDALRMTAIAARTAGSPS